MVDYDGIEIGELRAEIDQLRTQLENERAAHLVACQERDEKEAEIGRLREQVAAQRALGNLLGAELARHHSLREEWCESIATHEANIGRLRAAASTFLNEQTAENAEALRRALEQQGHPDKCARCGFPRKEHSHTGACYGLCGKFEQS